MAIQFLNTVQVDTDVLYVDTANDRVGIGTTNPTATLDVYGNLGLGTTGTFSITQSPFSTTVFYVGAGNGSTITFGAPASNTQNVSVQGDLDSYQGSIGTKVSGSFNNKISYNGNNYLNSGNLGIGTTSPTRKLQVLGPGNSNPNSAGGILLQTSSGGGLDIYATSTAANPVFNFRTFSGEEISFSPNSTELMRLKGSNVGIGTTAPSQKLHVAGTGLFSGTLYINDTSSSIYRYFNELIIQNTASTSVSIGGGPGSVTNNLEVNGAVTATASTDAYKGYIKQTITSSANEKVDNADYNLIPYNTLTTTSSNQSYNRMVAAYDGRIKKVYIKNTGGNTPTSDTVNFKKQINNTTSSTVYSATVANAGSAGMSAVYNFADNDFTFSEGDTFGVLYQTVNTGGGGRSMGGVAINIIIEYNIT